MADHQDTEPTVTDALDKIENLSSLRNAKCCRRFVEHNELGIKQQRARDRNRLALATRKGGDRLAYTRDAGGKLVQKLPRLDLHGHFIKPIGAHFAAKENIGDHVEILAQRQILKDCRNAEIERNARRRKHNLLTIKFDTAGCRLMDTCQCLDQGGLSCSVITDKSDNFARKDFQIDICQR